MRVVVIKVDRNIAMMPECKGKRQCWIYCMLSKTLYEAADLHVHTPSYIPAAGELREESKLRVTSA